MSGEAQRSLVVKNFWVSRSPSLWLLTRRPVAQVRDSILAAPVEFVIANIIFFQLRHTQHRAIIIQQD